MKNYLKFVVVVAGLTVATFSSVNAHAKKAVDSTGTCSLTTETCGFTGNGDPICGGYQP
jgi:hypothetical protein